MAAHQLLLHLHKLPAATPEESLAGVLETLWKTRKSGLSPLQKSYLQSLLNLPYPRELDPVLSCIRLIIRKVLKEKLSEEGMQKLLPSDLSNDFRKILVALLLKYQNLWEEDAARDQKTRLTFPGRVNAPPAFAPLQVSDIYSWPRENTKSFHSAHSGCPAPGYADSNLLHTSIVTAFRNNDTSHDPTTLPRLKCMSWTMGSRNSVPGNRLSIITLKLQDFTKSHLGDVEFKFHLSKDTLEAMLRSMAHINDQLSDSLSTASSSTAAFNSTLQTAGAAPNRPQVRIFGNMIGTTRSGKAPARTNHVKAEAIVEAVTCLSCRTSTKSRGTSLV